MKKYTLSAEKREVVGRKVKSLRKNGLVPANIFGKDIKSIAVQFTVNSFKDVYKEAGETGLVELMLDKEVHPILISNVQIHPVTDEIIHIDLREVNLKEKIEANVPVEVVGESEAEKSGLGTVVTQLSEIKVEALPTEIPENFTVDISSLKEVDQAIYVKDLAVPKAVEILDEPDAIVVKVEPQAKEEVVEAPAAEGSSVEEGQTEVSESKEETEPKEESNS